MVTVLVRMKFCDYVHKVDVNLNDAGELDVHIESECTHVMDFAEKLGGTITMDDVTQREGSKLFDPEVLAPLTMTCLVPNGVLDAAWLELGMLSKSQAKKVGGNEISYELVE